MANRIADMDNYEVANIQRQCGAFCDTLGKNKSETNKYQESDTTNLLKFMK